MIGSFIKGHDITGQDCQGVILDKVLCLQSFEMPVPKGMPPGILSTSGKALDAYLVMDYSTGQTYLVNPAAVDEIEYKYELMYKQDVIDLFNLRTENNNLKSELSNLKSRFAL